MKEQNWSHYLRAQDSIAQSALTNSKRAECFVKGIYQTHATTGTGPFILDCAGKQKIDFICGMGSMLLGHGNHQIAQSIYSRAVQGITLSLSSVLELTVAEKLKEMIPWITKMKFLKTGTEACMAAVKIARAKTGKTLVLSEGYHGWSDEFVALTPPALGVNPHPSIAKLESYEVGPEVAAVIVEPIITDASPERVQWLRDLREKCTRHGVILIFDEVITGFRFPKFSVSTHFGIEPDIICFGKAFGGGMPLSCVAGKDDIMNCGEYFVSSTFAGETCSLAASLALMEQLQSNKYKMDDLWAAGGHFLDSFNRLYPEKIKLAGYPTRAAFEGDPLVKALLWQEAYRAGILFGPSLFISFAHIPYLDRVLNVLGDIVMRIKTGSVELKGEMPVAPLAQKIREKTNG